MEYKKMINLIFFFIFLLTFHSVYAVTNTTSSKKSEPTKNMQTMSISSNPWIGDTNDLFSGGIENAERITSNSVLLVNLTIEMEQFNGWRGGLFSAQFLQQNAQNTNAQAGLFQGYNSLPDVAPFNRSELYALWYRQALFDDKFFAHWQNDYYT